MTIATSFWKVTPWQAWCCIFSHIISAAKKGADKYCDLLLPHCPRFQSWLYHHIPAVWPWLSHGTFSGCLKEGDIIVLLSYFRTPLLKVWASQVALVVKNLLANAGDIRDVGLISGLEELLKEGMTTTPVFLPGECHGQRTWLKRLSTLAIIRKCKARPQQDTILHYQCQLNGKNSPFCWEDVKLRQSLLESYLPLSHKCKHSLILWARNSCLGLVNPSLQKLFLFVHQETYK